MKIYTKESLTQELLKISEIGWVKNARSGNDGGIGNTLEDLLGIEENNLPIPNAAEWELKTQRINTTSLTTLFHIEPSPRAIKFVPKMLLPNYGWKHKKAGLKYPVSEMSFRATIHAQNISERGFSVQVNRNERKILVSFDSNNVHEKHGEWLRNVKRNIGLKQLSPQPYWGFDDLEHKAGTKLLNAFYVQAEVKKDKETKEEYYRYSKIMMLQKFSIKGFIGELERGNVLVDFDARTGHNHGTKFRMRRHCWPQVYQKINVIK